MSEANSSPVEMPDPFQGQETTHEEFSKWRETGELPERFKPADTEEKEAPAANAEIEDGKEPPKETEQEKEARQRDPKGKFRAKVEFSPEQQEVLNREIKRAKEKARRELEQQFSAKTSVPQATAADKKPVFKAEDFLTEHPPERPEPPDPDQFSGTWAELKAAQKEALEQRDAWIVAKIKGEQLKAETDKARAAKEQAVEEGVKKFMKKNPDYMDEMAQLDADIKDGTLPNGKDLIDFVTYNLDAPVDVIYYLCKNRDVMDRILAADPYKAAGELYRIDGKIQAMASNPAPAKAPAPPKPKPPDPVGARASSSGFDVNDESIDADTWARQRNEQVAKRRR